MQKLHRTLGIVTVLILVMLLVSGLLLNHSPDLSLDKRFVGSNWLLEWYGIEVPDRFPTYLAGTSWYAQIANRVYRDTDELQIASVALIGALSAHGITVLGFEDHLTLLTPQGAIADVLDAADGLDVPVRRIGRRADERVFAESASGIQELDLADLSISPAAPGGGITWSSAATPPPAVAEALSSRYRGRGLSVQRLLLDIHTGRIGGWFGVMIVDAAAVAMVLLALSGVWLWLKQRRMRRFARQRRPDL